MKLRQKLGDQRPVQGNQLIRPRQVKLHTVAGAENDRFAAVPRRQIVQGTRQLFLVEGDLLTQLHGCRAVTAAHR